MTIQAALEGVANVLKTNVPTMGSDITVQPTRAIPVTNEPAAIVVCSGVSFNTDQQNTYLVEITAYLYIPATDLGYANTQMTKVYHEIGQLWISNAAMYLQGAQGVELARWGGLEVTQGVVEVNKRQFVEAALTVFAVIRA